MWFVCVTLADLSVDYSTWFFTKSIRIEFFFFMAFNGPPAAYAVAEVVGQGWERSWVKNLN